MAKDIYIHIHTHIYVQECKGYTNTNLQLAMVVTLFGISMDVSPLDPNAAGL